MNKGGSKPRKVAITGDILRPAETAFRPSQSSNIRWFSSLVRRAVQNATGLPVEVITWGDGFDTLAFYESFGLTLDTAGWAELYGSKTLSLDAIGIVAEAFQDALVIGFELPTCLKSACSFLGLTWIDFAIHPVRFAPDLLFAMQTNSAAVLEFLNSATIHPDEFGMWADLMMATSAKMPGLDTRGAGTLLVGQTAADRVLIRDGQLLNFSHFGRELEAFCSGGPVLLKEHPYATTDFGLSDLRFPLSALQKTRSNMYRLLSSNDLKTVVGLSSSVLVEARYFFKEVVSLMELPFHLDFKPGFGGYANHFSIDDNVLSESFWRNALAGLGFSGGQTRPVTKLPPNTLRTSLQNFWGYNEMNSDLVAKAYQVAPSSANFANMAAGQR